MLCEIWLQCMMLFIEQNNHFAEASATNVKQPGATMQRCLMLLLAAAATCTAVE